jgi:opacity protein-like surface antigen
MNFKQFALSGRYTMMKFSGGKLRFIDTYSTTAVYSYGNIISFAGYSRIMMLYKYGVAGISLNASFSNIKLDNSTFLAPSFTAFYTIPVAVSRRLTLSPELYIMANPIMYSTKDKVTSVDRSVGFFGGSGVDYQISKKFKVNFNYKLNATTKKDFPVLSFFLIGSKINL